jgi:hypothetical protein
VCSSDLRLMAGARLPTGKLNLPRLGRRAGDIVKRIAMPATNKMAAPSKAVRFSLARVTPRRVAARRAYVETGALASTPA